MRKTLILNVFSLDRFADGRVMKMNIRFKLPVNDLFGNSNNFSNMVVRDVLAINGPKAGE